MRTGNESILVYEFQNFWCKKESQFKWYMFEFCYLNRGGTIPAYRNYLKNKNALKP